jgi:membrane glycosyltransferase
VATEPLRELPAQTSGVGASATAAHDTRDARSSETPSSESSHVRARAVDQPSRATRRVAEYLWTLGLADSGRVLALAEQIALQAYVEDAEEHASASVRLAQQQFESWRTAVFSGFAREPDPLWLRAFLAASPAVFLEDPALGRAAAKNFGDPEAGRTPVHARFAAQGLEPARIPVWLRGLLPPLFVTAGAALALLVALGGHGLGGQGLNGEGLGALELVWVGLFAFLFGLSAIGCCTALLGLGRRAPRPATPDAATSAGPLPRSAVVMPIYHESAEQVFAALAAMRQSLLACPGAEAFEIFVLSDSRDPLLAAEEERAFRRVTARAGDGVPMFYRRRAQNHRQKAGNLSEFFERWGHRYEYVLVLDADSLMTGASMVELVRRLHASPRLALLQAPIALAGGETPFARMLQFASSLCGPLFTRGLSRWSGPHANYYGHNAAIRVRAFLDCCALPRLAGKPPFGGEILSHDFVEAALLCREGWEVRIAHDLAGSFEGLPPTLAEYVARDRRWCQGNLQHLRVLGATGLRPMSRLHLSLGVAAYLAGPAWLLFLMCGIALAKTRSSVDVQLGVWVTACTAALLLVPRVLGLLVTAFDRDSRRAHGGLLGLGFGLLFELLLAAALAPLLMLHHTRIVFSILLGNAVGWGVQRRRATGGFGGIVRSEASTTLLGWALFGACWYWAPQLLGWLAPIWAPWSLAIVIAAFASSKRIGALTRRLGLLLVPSETEPDELVVLAEELCAFTASDQAARFRDLVLDPVLVSAHVARLSPLAAGSTAAAASTELRQRALRVGPAGLSELERQVLTNDAQSMHWLHREAWCHWPVEAWKLSHERPQLPE